MFNGGISETSVALEVFLRGTFITALKAGLSELTLFLC